MRGYTKISLAVGIIVIAGALIVWKNQQWFFWPTPLRQYPEGQTPSIDTNDQQKAPEVIAKNLSIPWGIAFLPDGKLLVTQRAGQLLLIDDQSTVIPVEGVAHRGEGGLLGLALHPEFEKNKFLYLYLTSQSGGGLINRVERYQLDGKTLKDRQVILDRIPGASNHDGGRLAFGPDGMLYITTGDAQKSNLAQDKNSLAGKILRVKDDGTLPSDNPFGNAVYSYGHRNVQGIAWDMQGKLWATEHGRSGIQSGLDEVNRITKGANYGWPTIQGDQKHEGMVTPVIHSGPNETWAPSGMTFINNRMFFAGLRGESLYSATIASDGSVVGLKAYFRSTFGRLRSVRQGPDGMLYLLTSNRDRRGDPSTEDDRIIRIDPDGID
ncbi:PQQ-dependent sugar dehydrogenase [Candidatus Uhrbacteria bacterium]|nr:PQQ-dependent sugar dehydrogenase [Candidatus Uhrbacteria bacterium]